jgi:hypothetical protein
MTADTRKRRILSLHLAGPADTPAVAPQEVRRLALVKKALRLFRGRGIDKATRHRNARKWLAARAQMGDKHVLKGHQVSWGVPGEHADANGVYAPRRYGAK